MVPLQIDDGIRNIDVVTSLAFKTGKRKRAVIEVESQALAGKRMNKLNQGMFVVVNLKPLDNDEQELEWYAWDFVIAEIDTDISELDTTNENTKFEVQVYRPGGMKISIDKKFIKWQGDDNKYFWPTIERGLVKASIELHVSSKKLSKQSKNIIQALTFDI